MLRIACFGENCVDINYIDNVIMPGGNCVNAAVYCRQLGHESAYVGTIADDAYGDLIIRSLDKFGIDHSMVKIAHGETGRSACRLVNGDRTLTMENGGGVIYTDPIIVDDYYLDYFRTFDLIHANYWAYLDKELIKIKKETGIPICYDFSQAWDENKLSLASEFADYILFSERKDLSKEENLTVMKQAVNQFGIKMSIMTFGTEGAYVYDGKKLYYKEPYNVAGGAIDTTGCGDSWISGFITVYMENMIRLREHRCLIAAEACSDPSCENLMQTAHDGQIVGAGDERSCDYFLTCGNIDDYEAHTIELAMSVGNMRARATCRIRGAYGCGVLIDDFAGAVQ